MLDLIFFGNSLRSWSVALGVFALILFLLRIAQTVFLQRLAKFAETTETMLDDLAVELFRKKKFFFNLAIAAIIPLNSLSLTERAELIAHKLIALAVLIQGGIWLAHLIAFVLTSQIKRHPDEDPAHLTVLNALKFVSRILVWSTVLLLCLDNLGFDITALIAGLGVGGIAVALAAQNILGDLFASLSIVLDKPFVLGDFIVVGDLKGTVEYIGLKTTRVRSLGGEEIIFSNTDLLQSRVRNFKRMFERRVDFSLGVTYETAHEKLQKIPAILKEIIEAQPNTRFDRAHFRSYGDFSLNFEAVYYFKGSDFNPYADCQQAINLEIFKRFQREKIDFAYPTQTFYVHQAKQ